MDDIRKYLAGRTGALHQRVDAAAGQHAGLDAAGAERLVRFLVDGAGRVERGLDRAGAAALLPEWPRRKRAPAAPDRADDPRFEGPAEAWGALYVLEGSRLGGRLLAREGALADHPFFADGADRGFWRVFLERLDAADRSLADREGMVRGAEKAFGAFLARAEVVRVAG